MQANIRGELAARHMAQHVGRDVAGDVGRYMREHAQKASSGALSRLLGASGASANRRWRHGQAEVHWADWSVRVKTPQLASRAGKGALGRLLRAKRPQVALRAGRNALGRLLGARGASAARSAGGQKCIGEVARCARKSPRGRAGVHWARCSARAKRRQIASRALRRPLGKLLGARETSLIRFAGGQRCIGQIVRCA